MEKTILLVDNEEIVLDSLAQDLRKDGYIVTTASHGMQALEKLQEHIYDVVITDLMMETIDGIQILSMIRKNSRETVVIILTGHADLDSAIEALRLGADDFLQKPCNYEELSIRLANVLEKISLQKQLQNARASAFSSEEALRQSEEKLRTMADFAYDWEYWIDSKGEFVYTSPSCERITGYSPSEFKQNCHLLKDICYQTDRGLFARHLQMNENTGKHGQALEFRIVTKDGALKWFSHNCQPVYSEDGQYLGRRASNRDITDRKKVEEELIKAKKLQAASVLAGGIAHDYNNLLTAIIGNIDLASMHIQVENKSSVYLENAKKASLRARDLTLKFLTFSMGSAPLKKITSIKSIVMDAAELALSGSNVKSVFKIPDDLWLVDADTGQLGQAFTNVIINGKESMVEGGVIEIEVENLDESDKKGPRILPAKRYVKISVRDSGCGIAEEDLDTIFDPYFSTKQRGAQKGMGLGLTVVHSVIEKHYGHIHIESKPGKGTLVEILLPAIGKEHQFSESDSSRGILVVEHASQNMRIMVMDDEEIVRDVAFTMLTQSGYAVDLVHDGAEAVALYKKRMNSDSPIDLSILDLTIPGGMGGKDTILEIHKLNPDAKVVVSSGYSSDPIMINYGVYGFCGAIGKPYQFQEFVKVVAKSLREKP